MASIEDFPLIDLWFELNYEQKRQIVFDSNDLPPPLAFYTFHSVLYHIPYHTPADSHLTPHTTDYIKASINSTLRGYVPLHSILCLTNT